MLKVLTDKNFDEEVLKSQKPVLIDFWSAWCQPCKIQMPIVEDLSKEYGDKIEFCKLEAGENPDTPAKYQVMSIPAIALFNEGKLLGLNTGLQNKNSIKKLIGDHLAM